MRIKLHIEWHGYQLQHKEQGWCSKGIQSISCDVRKALHCTITDTHCLYTVHAATSFKLTALRIVARRTTVGSGHIPGMNRPACRRVAGGCAALILVTWPMNATWSSHLVLKNWIFNLNKKMKGGEVILTSSLPITVPTKHCHGYWRGLLATLL